MSMVIRLTIFVKMMRILVLFVLAVGTALGAEPVQLDYHRLVGIPEATRIKQLEAAMDFDGSRIVGGYPSPVGTYPYLIGLIIPLTIGATSVCGSSMLSNTKSVTAAHCWWNGENQARHFEMVFGSDRLFSGGVRVITNQVEMHPNYHTVSLNNDVAVVTFSYVAYSNVIGPVSLPTGNDDFVGIHAQAVGFGRNSDSEGITLNQSKHRVNLRVITNAECLASFPNNVIASSLCTSGVGRVGTCGGDSGGPLSVTINNIRTLIGVISFGSARGCQVAAPSVFARVTSFAPWIRERL